MNLDEFTVVFNVLCEYSNSTPSHGLTMIYFEDLKDLTIEEFKQAFQVLRNTRVFNGLPKIAEIKEAIYGKTEDLVSFAWESLMETLRNHAYWDSVIFEDGAIGKAVETMGGWQRVSEWTSEEWRFRRKEFESLYLANLRRGNTEPIKLIGVFETHNGEEFKEFTPKEIIVKSKNLVPIESRKKRIKLIIGGSV